MADEETTPMKSGEELPGQEAPKEEVKGAETEKVKEEAPSTITKEEHERILTAEPGRYGGLDQKLTETRTDYESKLTGLTEELARAMESMEETRAQSFLTKVDDEGGDMTAAKAMVERERTARQTAQELKTQKAELDRQATVLNEASKGKQAQDLIKEHGLAADVLDNLLGSKSPEEMENKALKLHLSTDKTERRPTDKTDKGRGESKGRDTSKLSGTESLGRAMEEHEASN